MMNSLQRWTDNGGAVEVLEEVEEEGGAENGSDMATQGIQMWLYTVSPRSTAY